MELIQSIILGIVQGLTEFLPVSSSGHLTLLQNYFGEVDVGFDVLLHLATLLAVVCFFFKDIINLVKGFFSFRWSNEDFRMCIYLAIASIPAGIAGLLLLPHIYSIFSNLLLVGIGFFISGMFLLSAGFSEEKNDNLNLKNTFIAGLVQALAILPGISRSGSTSSTGIMLGVSREKAIRFSFLLAIPAILGAVLLNIQDMQGISLNAALGGFIPAFLAGLLGIFVFLKHFKLKNFKWLAFYCFILGLLSLGMYFL